MKVYHLGMSIKIIVTFYTRSIFLRLSESNTIFISRNTVAPAWPETHSDKQEQVENRMFYVYLQSWQIKQELARSSCLPIFTLS